MVKLSVLKGIRGQYRLRVRYRLAVLEYAMAARPNRGRSAVRGLCAHRLRWRARWRAEGLAGLVPRYPRRRASRVRPEVLEHIRHARETLHYGAARTRLWLLRGPPGAAGHAARSSASSGPWACPISVARGSGRPGS